jgi:hypothetical protein
MKHSRAHRTIALAAIAALLLGSSPSARADHPAAIPVAIVGGAIIGAAGAVLIMEAYQAGKALGESMKNDEAETETTTEDGGDTGGDTGGDDTGGGGDSGGDTGSGEGARQRTRAPALVYRSSGVSLTGKVGDRVSATYDDSTTHPAVTSFIERSGEIRMGPGANGYLNTRFRYSFDGNVMKAPVDVRRFVHDESLVFEATLDSGAIQDPRSCLAIELANLRLSTEDIPRTAGYVDMRIHVFEDGLETARRELLVRQGQTTPRPAWAQGPGWVFAKDRVDILSASVPIPCTPDPGVTNLKVAVAFEFSGARF